VNSEQPVVAVSEQEQEEGKEFAYMAKHVSDYAIFLMDAQGIIRTWNKAAQKMKGYAEEEIVGKPLALLYTDDDRNKGHPQHNLDKAAQRGTYQEETWRKRKDGSLFWAMVEIIALKKPNGELNSFCKITRDITVRKALQEQVAGEKERAQVTLRAIGDAVISVDADGAVDYLNPKAEQLTGWTVAEAVGHPFGDVFHAVTGSAQHFDEHQLMSSLKAGHGTAAKSPAVLISREGTRCAIEDIAAPIRLPDGRVTGAVVVFRDVTESRDLLNSVTYQATHDALTGLVNRIEFEHRLERSLVRAKTSHVAGAVLCMDLDRFKIVNDTCGHDAGDKLLQQLSRLYRDVVRERDTLARLGGDEFALIADRCSTAEACSIANKILQSTRDFQFVYKDQSFKVGISIGLATFDESTGDAEAIMQRADRACYIAKEQGRNRIHFHGIGAPGPTRIDDEIDWVTRLTAAMQQNQLKLHYQPIATANGRSSGFRCEVLLRLLDPVHGIILPNRFLPAAERYALMPAIDRWVVRQVVQWLGKNSGNVQQPDLCAINLSGKTLVDETFVGDVQDMIRERRIEPGKLCFEIDETAALIDMQRTQAMIRQLRALGCRICLAGFGTGMGSFAYLKQLPADFIKIDGSFISAIADSIVDEKMVTLVHEIAHLTGKETIAEWVENEATVEVLSRIGIDYLQGHWIAYPQELDVGMRSLH
jgi:diguanylate cyclase (GGDEF)-like protein/PAS domain S-box-containing protein